MQFSTVYSQVVGGLWVRLDKIKCGVLGRQVRWQNTSFNFAKRWHFFVRCQHKFLMLAGLPALLLTFRRLMQCDKMKQNYP